MFKKILVAEDFEGENLGILQTLTDKLNNTKIQTELYCDKAYNRFKVAQQNNAPFDLLITDLQFKESHITRKLTSGAALIDAIKLDHPKLKVIVFSMIDNVTKIKTLFENQKIDAYVCKGRYGTTELITAIQEVYLDKTYVSPQINLTTANTIFELDEFDTLILKGLENGLSKKEIAEKLKRQNISPNSESTIDKRVSKLFDVFEAKNTTHLVAKLTKMGLL